MHQRNLRSTARTTWTAAVAAVLTVAAPAAALRPPDGDPAHDALTVRHPDLFVLAVSLPIAELPAAIQPRAAAELAALGASAGYYDLRGDRWGTLVLARPLIPGPGVGNDLEWGAKPPATSAEVGARALEAFRAFLAGEAARLRVDPGELEPAPAVTVHEGGRIVQINARRLHRGIPVRDAVVSGVLNGGNLVLFGTRRWGSVVLATGTTIPPAGAQEIVRAFAAEKGHEATTRGAVLEIVPLESGADPRAVVPGQGYSHRLAWAVPLRLAGRHGAWEALVDAHTGELLAFADRASYFVRRVQGGVFPVSNDGESPNGIPDGVEQAGWPMPYADATVAGAHTVYADSGGNVPCLAGTATTALDGPYVRIQDVCGAIAETFTTIDMDLGAGPGTDCVVPDGHSAGDTHSARSGFYEVNRIVEQARGWLPDNAWLRDRLTANMNIDDSCNAFWDGSTINFYREDEDCRNTGEIAAVFDHEWGHGMDNNDADPTISSPGEAPADMYSILRLNDTCVARGFFKNETCDGDGDPCTVCTGVREADWTRRETGQPHTIAWILKPTVSPATPNAPAGGCVGVAGTQFGPCNQETHCEGSVPAEIVVDLIRRDLRGEFGSVHDLDLNTALNLVARLHYLGGGNVGTWYQCDSTGSGGCNADGGYLNYLAVDDDNGSLSDGTPHMTALFAAFDRHQMACPTPAVQDAGCAGAPTTAPTVSVEPRDAGARVSWAAVDGAQAYWVYRADGLFACDIGKARVGITASTTFFDDGLKNGRSYYYTVEAVGASDACRGPASACATVVPSAGANLLVVANSGAFQPATGDGDRFLDNCESGSLVFQVQNSGVTGLTGVRVTGAEVESHADVLLTTSFPVAVASSLAECGVAQASLPLQATGLAHDDTVVVRVDVTSDQLAPRTKSFRIELRNAESDLVAADTASFDFDQDGDLEGWKVVRGTFTQEPGGPPPDSSFYLASSAAMDDQCDEARSPLLLLSADSTLSLFNQFSIEPGQAGTFYDRANVGLYEAGFNVRTPVVPDSGRMYTASGAHGACVTGEQEGWEGAGPGWLESGWSAAALRSGEFAGRDVHLDVAYGTDPLVSGTGFWFDQVVVTKVELQVEDAQACVACDLKADAGADRSNCAGTGTTIGGTTTGGTPPYTYSWSPSAGLSSTTDASPTADPAASTLYTVSVTDAMGCGSTDSVWVFAGESDTDGDQAPDCVELEEGTDPLAKDNDVFASDRLFVLQQYRDFLGREGDDSGVLYWSARLAAGELSRPQVIEHFFFSPEFQGSSAPVTRLYFAYFLRIPDYAGLLFWIEQNRNGTSLAQISDAFAASEEFQETYGSLSNAEFVDLVYRNVLGRDPDPEGAAFWTAELDSGRRTRGQVMLEFSESAEYRGLIQNEVFVTQMYVGMLRRSPEQGGFDFWVGQLDQGRSGTDLIGDVYASDEYHDRFLP